MGPRDEYSVDGFEFNAWNLGEAKLAINYFLKDEERQKQFTVKQIYFLKETKEIIDTVFREVIQIQKIHIDPEGYSCNGILNKARISTENAVKFIQENNNNLKMKLEEERINSPKDNQYNKLIQLLFYCADGIEKGLSNLKNIKYYENHFLYKLADNFGATIAPMMQCFDPLQGSNIGVEDRFAKSRGRCYGYIAKSNEKTKKSKLPQLPVLVLDKKAYRRHAKRLTPNQHDSNLFFRENFVCSYSMLLESNLKRIVDDMLKSMRLKETYFLSFSMPGCGHVVSLRNAKTDEQNCIEFFDPNFGVFLFQDEPRFKQWLLFLFHSYIDENNCDNITMWRLGRQLTPELQQSSIPPVYPPDFVPKDFFKDYQIFEEIAGYILSSQEPEIHKNSSIWDTLKIRKNIFLEFFNFYISHVEDMTILTNIKSDIEQAARSTETPFRFLFIQRTPLFDKLRLWNHSSDTWSMTETAKAMKAILDGREGLLMRTVLS